MNADLVNLFVAASLKVDMSINRGLTDKGKVARAYQFKEDEDKIATVGGHSPLQRSREILSIQD